MRSLRKAPILTALMVMSVAFGVAASMTTYAVFRAVSGDPIPWKSRQLFFPQLDVWGPASRAAHGYTTLPSDLTYTDAMALMRRRGDIPQTAIYPIEPTVYAQDPTQKPRAIAGQAVFVDFFKIVDAPFRYGSAWSAQDDQDRTPLAVISDDLNQRLFGGTNSIGRDLRLNDLTFRIVGVLKSWRPQPKFYNLANNQAFEEEDDVFVPFNAAIDAQMDSNGDFYCNDDLPATGFAATLVSSCVWVGYMVQLSSPAQISAYGQRLDGYMSEQRQAGRFNWPANYALPDLQAMMQQMHVVPAETKMSVVVAASLLIVCMVNAIGLLLAKFLRRSGEIGVRRALGATRGAIVLQFGAEAAAVGVAGGVLGLLLTGLGVTWMQHVLDPRIAELVRVDALLMLETLLLAVVATVIAGMYPILRAAGVRPAMQLKID
nr:ABC transporter permease [Dyella flava]